jgi:ATP-dependent exoDNAse (exonuclease V) beta subunit
VQHCSGKNTLAKPFQIFRSSAGSGKTRTLAKEYLKLALRFKSDYFQHILAVTFTNKSTQEMKDRIMQYLDDFARAKENELAAELREELNLSAPEFQQRSLEVQSAILHDYSKFSISTIDAFFQKVIRSFTYEAGIAGDYRLEVDYKPIIEEVIANLVDELGNNQQLTDWVVELALQNLADDKPWDMRQGLMEFSSELFRDEFKEVEEEIVSLSEKNFLNRVKKVLSEKKYEFIHGLRARAAAVLADMHSNQFSAEDFSYQYSGIYGFFDKLAKLDTVSFEIGTRVEGAIASDTWTKKTHPRRIEIARLAEAKWIPLLKDIFDFREKYYQGARSAEEALKNFYSFGLITDISRKLIEYKKENNLMLLSDAPQFLHKIINDSDTPFIYEKVGSYYRNFLIDEFQDTSSMQWRNFLPLLVNNLDSGYPSLVVGDVKQSIYRWRGGDKNLLQRKVSEAIGEERISTRLLNKNFRSAARIVSFNNTFFNAAATIVSLETNTPVSGAEYKDVEQEVIKEREGFVHARFFEDKTWREDALSYAAKYAEDLQQQGASPHEIAFLVRRKEEGKQIISYLLDRKGSGEAVPGVVYDVVSSESLLIGGAAVVNFLVAALKYLHQPDDDIARAQLAFEQARFHPAGAPWSDVFAISNQTVFEQTLPPDFANKKIQLRKLPLFELVETLIAVFKVQTTEELPYLLGFQDAVLEFVSRERNDLGAFLEWWEEQKEEKSIIAPTGSGAMQLMTIHKAKGLQFKYVIIPFCNWPMDHETMKRPNLWVKADQSFFKDIGYVPVRYSSKLRETFFGEAYEQEHADIYLDNLNLLYVAFTRAEAGLAFFAPANAGKSSAAKLVYDTLISSPLNESWNAAVQSWKSGEMEVVKDSKPQASPSAKLGHYPVSNWREKLVIKKSAWAEAKPDDESRAKILQGIYIHAALSTVTYATDFPLAVQRLVDSGMIASEEVQALETTFELWMQNPMVADWFSTSWHVQNESVVLLSNGESVRIDRLITKGTTARIIDFKTGKPKKEDQVQVIRYCDLLREMGFEPEGYLLYLTEGEVVHVGALKKKPAKKKPENQLGLDF